LIAPALITWILVKVSGVPMVEHRMKRKRLGYDEYIQRTSAFLPRRPKSP